MGATATVRPNGLTGDRVGDVRSALIAEIVQGELVGPMSAETWRALGMRHEAPAAALRLAAIELHELGLLTVDDAGLRVSGHESWRLFAPAVFRELDRPCGRNAISAYMDARRFVDADLSALAAGRRSVCDVVQLSRARRSFWASAHGSEPQPVRLRSHRAADEQLRCAIARASHNRYLADVSIRLRRRVQDADWMARQALTCPVAASAVNALIDAIRHGDVEQASHAAQAEIDLIESWAWRRLSGSGRRR